MDTLSINIKKTKILTVILLFIYLKPHFYYFSYTIARLSDAIGILILLLIILILGNSTTIHFNIIKYNITKYMVLSYLFILLILLSIINSTLTTNQDIVLQDFVDIMRPISIFIALLVGVIISKYQYTIDKYVNFLFYLGIFATLVSFLEKLGFLFFYQIYSDQNHMLYNRVTGIYYDFAEFGIMQTLALTASIIKFINTKKKIYVIYCILIISSIFLSTSKASIILLILFLLMLTITMLLKIRFYTFKNIVQFILIITIFIYIANNFITTNETLSAGIEAIIQNSEENASVGNRIIQRTFVIDEFMELDLQSLIGHSASRSTLKSYIEITFFSILYRYGLLGLILYYLPYILYIIYPIEKPYNLFKYVIISSLLLDTVASMTSRFSFPIAIFILLGIILTYHQKSCYNISVNKE